MHWIIALIGQATRVAAGSQFHQAIGRKGLRLAALAALFCAIVTPLGAQLIRLQSVQFDPMAPAGGSALAGMDGPLFASRSNAPTMGEERLELVQWDGPVSPEQIKSLVAAGARLITPIPDHAYLVALPQTLNLADAKASGPLAKAGVAPRWNSTLAPGWKLAPEVAKELQSWIAQGRTQRMSAAGKPDDLRMVRVQIARAGGEGALRKTLTTISKAPTLFLETETYEVWTIETSLTAMEALARENSVFWIEPYVEPQMLGERGGLILANQIEPGGACLSKPGLSYQQWLDQVGLSGQGQVVSVFDDGLSQGIATNDAGTAHVDMIGRIVGIDNATDDALGNSVAGHGHINASIIMGKPLAGNGRVDKDGYLLGQGIAPEAQVFATKIFRNDGRFDLSGQPYSALTRRAYAAGSRVSSNSWGANTSGSYNSDSQAFDLLTRDSDPTLAGHQSMLFVFAAGNAGPGPMTIGSPATAKNVVAVGAAENCDQGQLDGSGISGPFSDNINDVAVFSSRGPTRDGRNGVTLVAAGTHVTGAASDDPNFDGTGVSGRAQVQAGEPATAKKYYPALQTDYTWSSGTSHSTPIVAGAALLLRQYFLAKNGAEPSPALLRAALIAGTTTMQGGSANLSTGEPLGSMPNRHVGWGRANLDDLVNGRLAQFSEDQLNILTASGQQKTIKLQVSDPSLPMRIVLAWTDSSATPLAGKALINDLDLTVSDGTSVWKGNVFANGESIPGGEEDRLNNQESVFLQFPAPGVYEITVTAYEILGDARPGVGSAQEQDYALFVSNGSDQSPVGQLTLDRSIYACSNDINVTVSDGNLRGRGTYPVVLQNLNTLDTETLSLQEVDAPSGIMKGAMTLTTLESGGISNNGVLFVRDGDVVRVTYTDETIGSDGKPIKTIVTAVIDCQSPGLLKQLFSEQTEESAQLELTLDEPVSVRLELGTERNVFTQVFQSPDFSTLHELTIKPLSPCTTYYYQIILTDRAGNQTILDNNGNNFAMITKTVDADFADDLEPAPVSGWAHQANIGTDDWTALVTNYARSGNNAWFTADVDSVKDAWLSTPPMLVKTGARFAFWHTYEFETAGISGGFDGSVLEISDDNGQTWSDLGSAIVQGGYNSTIASGFGNPLAGREAWSGGTLGAMTRVVVDLNKYTDKIVKVRFRIGCDSSFGGEGWYLDDISLERVVPCIGDLAQLIVDPQSTNCTSGRVRFTLLDNSLSAPLGGVPSSFSLSRLEEFVGKTAAPSELSRIDDRGIWEGYLTIQPSTVRGRYLIGGTFEVREGELFRLNYSDLNVGGTRQTASTLLALDCTPPVMVQVTPFTLSATTGRVIVEAAEPVKIELQYGTSRNAMNQSLVNNGLGLTGAIDLVNLQPCTAYFFRVVLTDAVGNQAVYDNLGQAYGLKTLVGRQDLDTLEPPQAGWTHKSLRSPQSDDDWKIVTDGNAHSPSHAWFSAAQASIKDTVLETPPKNLTPGTQLSFWHNYRMEDGFDGLVLEITTDNGLSWQDLGPNILIGQYDKKIATGLNSPIAGREAWTGGRLVPNMKQVVVDLSSYVGEGRRVRFRMACDESVADGGWWIDDVEFTIFEQCDAQFPGIPVVLAPANNTLRIPYDQPLTLDWSDALGAERYQVFIGERHNQLAGLGETTQTEATLLPSVNLKASTRYYWRVMAVNGLGSATSPLMVFQTDTVSSDQVRNHLLGLEPGLTPAELSGVDYNNNGLLDISDLVINVNRQEDLAFQ